MALPQNFQTIMLPFLNAVSDGQNHNMNDVIEVLAEYFKLTEEEKSLQYPTGSDYIFRNKARFARLFLLKAGLLEYPQRGFIKISTAGLSALAKKPREINLRFLEEYPKFLEFKKATKENNKEKKESTIIDNQKQEIESQTPQELIEYGYQKIKEELSQEILNYTKQISPNFFEKLVIELLLKMGYGGSLKDAGRAIGKSGDGGIDGIIKEDKLGLDVIYIQAKRWDGVVGRPEIQKFVGALADKHANKGIFITTSDYTQEAMEYAGRISNKIVLINGEMLTDLMIENDIGVSNIISYSIKRIDFDYFIEE